MTVRVNKSSFNIREKLSELERPIGLKGSELMRSETAQEARDLVRAGRKNLIINGDCRINQRFGSGTYTLTSANSYFVVDRFKTWAVGGGEFTIQRSDDAPPGFKNSLMYTVSTADSSLGSGDYYVVQHRVEGYNFAHLNWGTSDAKPVTLSFWVKADVTGKYGISFWPGGQGHNYVTSYSINTADTWEYKTITIPGATGGTWLTDNSTGFGIWWDFGVGTTYTTATTETWGQSAKFAPSDTLQMIKTNGAKFRMTGVQLEVGKNATEFEHRSFSEELALCMRYYQNSYHLSAGKYPGNTDADNGVITTSWTDGNAPFPMFRVPMRAQPTIILRGRQSSTTGQVRNEGTLRSAYAAQITNQGVGYIQVSSGTGGGYNAYTFECLAEL